MKSLFITIITLIFSICIPNQAQQDGQFLRGEKYTQYTVASTDADFYVSPTGNDNWSGTLSAPNKDETDGPFATIKRAKAAVRELKSKIYKPKEN